MYEQSPAYGEALFNCVVIRAATGTV